MFQGRTYGSLNLWHLANVFILIELCIVQYYGLLNDNGRYIMFSINTYLKFNAE